MKWRNYGLWVSIASVLYMVLKDLGFTIDLTHWHTYVTALLGILIALGIVSNPESGKGFFNTKISPSSNTDHPINTDLGIKEPSYQANRFDEQPVKQILDPNTQSNQITNSINSQDSEPLIPYRRNPPNEK